MSAPTSDRYYAAADALRALARAEDASQRAAAARSALPPGSSRARVTTANARWARAAEHRDRCITTARAAVQAAGLSADLSCPDWGLRPEGHYGPCGTCANCIARERAE